MDTKHLCICSLKYSLFNTYIISRHILYGISFLSTHHKSYHCNGTSANHLAFFICSAQTLDQFSFIRTFANPSQLRPTPELPIKLRHQPSLLQFHQDPSTSHIGLAFIFQAFLLLLIERISFSYYSQTCNTVLPVLNPAIGL